MKRCFECGRTLQLSSFNKNRTKKDGLADECRACTAIFRARRVLADERAAQVREASKKWFASRPNYQHERRKTNLERAMVNGARWRAKRDSVPFDLSPEDIVVPSHCPILGIELKVNGHRATEGSPSLDRKDPSLGYVRGNVRVVSMRANRLKSDGSLDEFRKIVAYMEAAGTILSVAAGS